MTSISAWGGVNSAWTVSTLFGSNSANGTPAAAPDGASAATQIVTTSSTTRASGQIAGLIATLNAQKASTKSSQVPGAAPGAVSTSQSGVQDHTLWSDPFGVEYQTNSQKNATFTQVNNMSSEDLSAALYGKGITVPVGDGQTTFNFASVENWFSGIVASTNTTLSLSDSGLTDAEKQIASKNNDQLAKLAQSLQTAFDNHTLVIQNAADVDGLQFEHTLTYNGDPNSTQYGSIDETESYNANYLWSSGHDGKQHDLFTTGMASLYFTW